MSTSDYSHDEAEKAQPRITRISKKDLCGWIRVRGPCDPWLLLTFYTSTGIYPVSIVYRRRNEEVEERSFAGHTRSFGAPVAEPGAAARARRFRSHRTDHTGRFQS